MKLAPSVLIGAILLTLPACPRTPPPIPGEDAGAACVDSQPRPRPEGWRCERDTDCYDVSNCTSDVCNLTTGQCKNDAGATHGCDQGMGWHGVCVGKMCCPEGSAPPATTLPAPR
jgi:hypothetical protein